MTQCLKEIKKEEDILSQNNTIERFNSKCYICSKIHNRVKQRAFDLSNLKHNK
jgi:hypothetical protein